MSTHKLRKSNKTWALKGQLTAPVTSYEHIKVTASNKNGAFQRILRRHGVVEPLSI